MNKTDKHSRSYDNLQIRPALTNKISFKSLLKKASMSKRLKESNHISNYTPQINESDLASRGYKENS